jgi:hypothetical protein
LQGSAGDVPAPEPPEPDIANVTSIADSSGGPAAVLPPKPPHDDIDTLHPVREPSEFGESGVRLKADVPREHYKNIPARNDAAKGLLKRAEIAEAGHGCFYCHDIHFQTPEEADRNLDLAHYDAVATTLVQINVDLATTIATEGTLTTFSSARSVWEVESYAKALMARDDVVRAFRLLPNKDIKGVATVVGGYSRVTGEVTVGTKWFRTTRNGVEFCAEDVVVSKLGGEVPEVVMTPAIRPPSLQKINVCVHCQKKFPMSSFGPGTEFDP